MEKAETYIDIYGRAQYERLLQLAILSVGCCEKLTEIGTHSARTLIAQTKAGYESLSWGTDANFVTTTARIGLDCCASMAACVVEFQRQAVDELQNK